MFMNISMRFARGSLQQNDTITMLRDDVDVQRAASY
jgi:hypothetical protein